MPTDQARRPLGAVAASDAQDASMALATDTGAHIAQTIGPATDGCRTIVLTVDGGDAATTSAAAATSAAESSILDGGLDATWVVPARSQRFARGSAIGEAAPETVADEPVVAAGSVAPPEPTPVDSAPRGRAGVEPRFHAGGDDAAIARVAAERQAAERRHAERRRRAAEAKPSAPARRRNGAAAAAPAAVPAPVERHTVRITGTPDPRLMGATLAPLGDALDRRRWFPVALNPVAGLLERPDRLAMWAVLLGVFLVLVAATSG